MAEHDSTGLSMHLPGKDELLQYLKDNPFHRHDDAPMDGGHKAPTTLPVSPEARKAYQFMVAQTIIADGDVDPEEIARLYCVFAVLDTEAGERLELVRRLAFEPDAVNDTPVPDEILKNDELRFALARDALFVGQLQQGDPATQQIVREILGRIQLTPTQADVMFDWVSLENRVLRQLGAGDEWMSPENSIKELTKRAAAVGLPIGALSVAGLAGLSAAGISSGLATIGGWTGLTLLNINPMTAGVAALIMAGITLMKVADHALPASPSEAQKRAATVAQILGLELRAATRLAQDIPDFAASPGIFRGKSRKQMTSALQDALVQMLERASAPLEAPPS